MKIKTILVIEDNKLNMKLVNGLVKIGKYRMLEAEDAESGIEMIRGQRPDLVLMDIQLPGMDGLSATKIIKEDSDLKDIPIVALTSYAMQGDEEKALAARMTSRPARAVLVCPCWRYSTPTARDPSNRIRVTCARFSMRRPGRFRAGRK